MTKVILIPGNGFSSPDDNWFPYVANELSRMGLEVINVAFPDQPLAREKFWLPFIKELGADSNTILIGHSTGAIATMRFAEQNQIFGSVLVSAYYTDLDNESEKESGYFGHPWDWKLIKNNQKWVIQFASTDDPFIPIAEPREVHKHLATEYHEMTDQNHFGYGDQVKLQFPELVSALAQHLT